MAELTTYIKLDRNITRWRWYQNANTFRVFLHCLICANIKDHDFEGITIHRGEFVTTYEKISDALGDITPKQVITAIKHLKESGELSATKHPKYQVIAVINYDKYQGDCQSNCQSDVSQMSFTEEKEEKYQKKNKEEYKNYNLLKPKNEKNIYSSSSAPAHTREGENGDFVENHVENTVGSCFRINALGGIGEGRVLLSDRQFEDLMDKLTVDEFNHYVSVVADCVKNGRPFKKSHYKAILAMAKEDRKMQRGG